jgi:beta-lactamase regulating signal transducer with metallopeptidase domain/thiol-disulfide isomerase/thioredoxin
MSAFNVNWSELSLQVMLTFGHFLWQACVVAITLLVVERLSSIVSRSTMNRRYTFACIAFFALPVCVVATFAWVHQSRGPVSWAASVPTDSSAIPLANATELTSPLASTDSPVLLPLAEVAVATQMPNDGWVPAPSWMERIQSFAPYLLIAYAIGVGLMLTRFGLSMVGSSQLRRTLQPIVDSNLLTIIAEQSSRLGLKRVPIAALCQRVSVPVVVGIVKPMILLPPALLCGLAPVQLAAILSHEIAHIRRYDLIVNLLQRIFEALLFFHPVTWWISRRIHIERENCCDDMAAAGCGRMEYAAALLRMAEQCATIRGLKIAPQLESLAADGGSTSQLGYRIKRLLGEDDTPRISLTRGAIAGIALTTAFSGLAMIAVAQSGGQETSIDRNGADERPSDSRRLGKSVPGPIAIAESATDDSPSNQTVQIKVEEVANPATKLARDTHANAAAIDRLPRFYWASDNGTLGTFVLSDPSMDSLDNLIRSLDAPDGGAKWFQYHAQFGWDENHYIESTGGTPTDEVSQFYWGTRELAGEKNGRGDAVRHVLRRDAAAMWKDHYLTFPNYILATRHVFWWGDNGDNRKILSGTGVPPAMADYEPLPDKTFDGELCHVIRSKARREMLLISKESGLLRGYVLIDPSGYHDDFYKSEELKKITGVEFSSLLEYTNWSRENQSKLSAQQKWELSKARSLACDWSTPTASLLVRFRDYREIAPGIMWPFREDRVQGAMRNEQFECMRTYDHVQEVAVDNDLTDTVNALRPKDGEQVQDQRFQAIVNYKFSKDRSNAEIMKLVDEAFERQMKDQLVVDRAKKPYQSMIGKPGPQLPEQNWIGGQRPELDGKPYLVHFWATWCGPCKNDLPRLKRFSDAGGIVVGMHPGGTATDEVTAAIKAAELSYPTYLSPETTSYETPMIAEYPATMYPYCVLVDGKGIVVAHGSLRDDKFDVFAQYWELIKSGKTNPSTAPGGGRKDEK